MTDATQKLKLLFLCTGNSCRSQMAEGWAGHLKHNSIDAYSAGTMSHGLNPNAVKVMAEAGVDISRNQSKTLESLRGLTFDWIITVCDNANNACPVFPGNTPRFHVPFDDPPRLAASARNDYEAMGHYRRVRDEIRQFVASLPESLEAVPHAADSQGQKA